MKGLPSDTHQSGSQSYDAPFDVLSEIDAAWPEFGVMDGLAPSDKPEPSLFTDPFAFATETT
jgi:hypothetical protein